MGIILVLPFPLKPHLQIGTKDCISYLLNNPQIHSILYFPSNFVQILRIFYLDYIVTSPLCLLQCINPLSHSFTDLCNFCFYKQLSLTLSPRHYAKHWTQLKEPGKEIWLTKMTIQMSWCCAGVSSGRSGVGCDKFVLEGCPKEVSPH